MQRLAKASDYVFQDVAGRSMYVLPWETRLCPGNPTEDPEIGAAEYNEYTLQTLQEGPGGVFLDQVSGSVDWALKTPGEPARGLAADMASAYLGDYQFSLEDLGHWDVDTRHLRADLAFRNAELRKLSARQVMALRARAVQA